MNEHEEAALERLLESTYRNERWQYAASAPKGVKEKTTCRFNLEDNPVIKKLLKLGRMVFNFQ